MPILTLEQIAKATDAQLMQARSEIQAELDRRYRERGGPLPFEP